MPLLQSDNPDLILLLLPFLPTTTTTTRETPHPPAAVMNKGIVKSVISGDTIVVRGRPVNGPPPEKQLSLAHVVAPRLGRKDAVDEAFAWGSREFLRKHLIGKEISFKVEYTSQAGREYASVFLGEENVVQTALALGWVKLQESKADKAELGEWKALETAAQGKDLGIWQKGDQIHARVRDVKWTIDNPQALIDKNKGKPVKGISFHLSIPLSFYSLPCCLPALFLPCLLSGDWIWIGLRRRGD